MNRPKAGTAKHKPKSAKREAVLAAMDAGNGLTDRQRRGVLAIMEAPTMEGAA